MPAPLNLSGQQFGRLTALSRKESDKNGQARWFCQCLCGVEKVVSARSLVSGKTQSCGCLYRPAAQKRSANLEGRVFGRLTVIARDIDDARHRPTWKVRCTCGTEKIVASASLLRGATKSCGCLRIEKSRQRVYPAGCRSGEKSPSWKGGITPEHKRLRASEEYKIWRTSVFIRDNYCCQTCGDNGYLHAHHIKSFAHFPDLRFEVSNGQTLCVPCHEKTPTYKQK